MWLLSHVGLAGNVPADAEAKAALTLFPVSSIVHTYSCFKPVIHSYAAVKWQKPWDAEVNNKFYKIQPPTHSFSVNDNMLQRALPSGSE
jgi:hypothetical protein